MAPYLFGFAGVLATAAVTYLVARRQHSGSIRTTEAATLWAESAAMRKELHDEVVGLRKRIDDLENEVERLHGLLHERGLDHA